MPYLLEFRGTTNPIHLSFGKAEHDARLNEQEVCRPKLGNYASSSASVCHCQIELTLSPLVHKLWKFHISSNTVLASVEVQRANQWDIKLIFYYGFSISVRRMELRLAKVANNGESRRISVFVWLFEQVDSPRQVVSCLALCGRIGVSKHSSSCP